MLRHINTSKKTAVKLQYDFVSFPPAHREPELYMIWKNV